jgi:hypothetical protein
MHFTTGAYFYSWLVSILYILTDSSPLMAAGINCLFSTLIAWNVYRTVLLVTRDTRLALTSGWLVALFPMLIVFQAVTLREVAVIYPFTLGILHLTRWDRGEGNLYGFSAVALFGVSTLFHTGMIGALAGTGCAIFLMWLRSMRVGDMSRRRRLTIAILPYALTVTFIVSTGMGLEKLRGGLTEFGAESIGAAQERAAVSRAAYLQGMPIRSPIDVVWQLPIRAAYFLFAPFPWMVHSATDIIGFMDGACYLMLCFLIFRRRSELRRYPTSRFYLAILCGAITVFALGTSNYGTALRHRAKLVPLIFVLYTLTLRKPVASTARSRADSSVIA